MFEEIGENTLFVHSILKEIGENTFGVGIATGNTAPNSTFRSVHRGRGPRQVNTGLVGCAVRFQFWHQGKAA